MKDLDTGTLLIKSKQLEETSDHISRLSVRCNLNGMQHYNVGGNDFMVRPDNYLLVNQGQHYKTSFESDTEQEMILVAFQPGFAESLFYSLVNPAGLLLDAPFGTHEQPVNFFEKTYPLDPVIRAHFLQLRRIFDLDIETKKGLDIDAIYTAMLTRIVEIQIGLSSEINSLKKSRHATRVELYRRLSIAKDFMEANLDQKVTLNDIATAACLSVHHFKREFKMLFGISPHRYLFMKRMEQSERLLKSSSLNISEIAATCGFENLSSFTRQFKGYTKQTPGTYRSINNGTTVISGALPHPPVQ